jgi:hypothetical protein
VNVAIEVRTYKTATFPRTSVVKLGEMTIAGGFRHRFATIPLHSLLHKSQSVAGTERERERGREREREREGGRNRGTLCVEAERVCKRDEWEDGRDEREGGRETVKEEMRLYEPQDDRAATRISIQLPLLRLIFSLFYLLENWPANQTNIALRNNIIREHTGR